MKKSRLLSKNIIKIISKYSDIKYFHFNIPLYEKHLFPVSEQKDKIDWIYLCQNTNIPYTFFEKHLDKVDWISLSSNINIPLSFFERYLNKVNWNRLSGNTNI